MRIVRLFVYATFLIWSSHATSQPVVDDIYTSFENFTTKQGLSNNTINDLYQDVYGFIWIATENGLNRFDGYSFVVFQNHLGDSTSISCNVITSIDGDEQGNLWVGTTEGLNFFNRKKGDFTSYLSDYAKPNSLRSNHVRKVLLDGEKLWIETLDGSLSSLHIPTMEFNHFSHRAISQPYYRYHTLWKDDDGFLWIGGRNLGLHVFDPVTSEFKLYNQNLEAKFRKRENDFSSILKTSSKQYYVAGLDGVYGFNPTHDAFEKIYSTTTYSLVEYEDGNILMGSGYGLVLYNPLKKTFIRYTQDIDNPNSLINNSVVKVLVDRGGNIWLGTNGGLSLLRKQAMGLKHYFHISGNNHTVSGNTITSILGDSKGRVWVGTKSHGLNLWDTITNRFSSFSQHPTKANSIRSNNISKIYEDSRGNIWVGLWSGVGFNKIDAHTGRVSHYAIDHNRRTRDWYNDIYEDFSGNLWMGVWGANGVQRFDVDKGIFTEDILWSQHVPIQQDINQIAADGMGNLFLATNTQSVYQYNILSRSFEAYTSPTNQNSQRGQYRLHKKSLPFEFDTLYSVASNLMGVTVFVSNNGFFAYDYVRQTISPLESTLKQPQKVLYSEIDNSFWIISTDRICGYSNSLTPTVTYTLPQNWKAINPQVLHVADKNSLWLAAEQGLFLYNMLQGTIAKVEGVTFEKTLSSVQFATVDGNLIYSTEKGLVKVDAETLKKEIVHVKTAKNSAVTKIIGLVPLDNGRVFIFSDQGMGILSLSTSELKCIEVNVLPSNYSSAIDLLVSSNDMVYVVSNKRIFEVNTLLGEISQVNIPDNRMVSSRLTTCIINDVDSCLWIGTSDNGLNCYNPQTKLFRHFNTQSLLPSDEVTALYQDYDNNIWIGTRKGLCYYNRESRSIVVPNNPLLSKRIASIVQSSDSAIWIGTNEGLMRYVPHTQECVVFNERDGLPSVLFEKGIFKFDNETIAMGTQNGLVVFDPLLLKKKVNNDPVVISGFNVYGQKTIPSLHFNDTIRLKHNENSFSISFSAMNFEVVGANLYAYNMTGMGSQWVTTSENTLIFADLRPGNYTFRIALADELNVHNQYSSILISILPPLWKTLWFQLMLISIASTLALLGLLHYIRQLKIREQNAVLEQKLLVSQMNPHFIFNSLSAIQAFMYSNEAEVAGNYLADFSRLVRLILENSRSDWVSIKKEVQTLELYLRLQQMRFSNKFDYEISIDPRISQQNIAIPPMLAQPFIENSIEHGIMHKKENGFIHISFSIDAQYMIIEILDDGIGMEQSKIINKNREEHTSLATAIVHERLMNFNRRIFGKTRISITDREDFDGQSGVRVLIRIIYKNLLEAQMDFL